MTYYVGQEIEVTASMRDLNGALADPTTVTAEVRDPKGNRTLTGATKTSTGVYATVFVPDKGGEWWYRFLGTGALEAAVEGTVEVQETMFP